MNNTTKIVIAAIAFVLIFIGAGVYMITQRSSPPISEPTPHESGSSSSSMPSVLEDRKLVPGTSSWNEAFAIFSQPSASASSTAPIVPDEKTITENPDGTTNTEITRPDFSKPKPPPPPKMDESQASDPTKEPEYTEEQLKPNQPTTPDKPSGGTGDGGTDGGTGDKPTTPDKPTGGETNNKGQVYVPGFGWMKPNTKDTEVDIAVNAGTGEVIGH